jgi:hypothetical protein
MKKVVDFLKRLIMSDEGKASLTKIGGKIMLAASTEVTLAVSQVIHAPTYITVACVLIGLFGGSMTIDGVRDAIGKIKAK